MRFLFDLSHPAVVHIYIPVIQELRRRGHEIAITSRDKDLTVALLNELGLEHSVLSKASPRKFGMLLELLKREIGLLRHALQFRPDVIAGTSANAARIARLLGVRSLINSEDDAAMIPLFRWVSYPFASILTTPWVLAFENHGGKHVTYPAFEKMFYLHPSRFTADANVRDELSRNSPDGSYILFRFSALQAHHDFGATGIPRDVVERLLFQFLPKTNVWLSSEKPLPLEWRKYAFPIPKRAMHHALAQASMLVCDSQSMSVEASVLGVKSFRLSSFVGRLSVLNEMDRRGLSEGFSPGCSEEFEARVLAYYESLGEEKAAQSERVKKLMAETFDPLPWFVEVLELLASKRPLSEVRQLAKSLIPKQAHLADREELSAGVDAGT